MSIFTEKDAQIIIEKITTHLVNIDNLHKYEEYFREIFGKKGVITNKLKSISSLSEKDKKTIGPKLQKLKKTAESLFVSAKNRIEEQEWKAKLAQEKIDPTKKFSQSFGATHPLSQVQRQVEEVFISLGFEVADGPDIETEWHNFDALNVPPTHPARDMQDTFWIKNTNIDTKKNIVMRTQTSNIQIRKMCEKGVPIKIIAPGRVFRSEEIDAMHDSTFYQVEGLYIDKNISMSHLKGYIQTMLNKIFGRKIKMRIRPGYFPFVEPGIEVDIWFTYTDKSGKKCEKWLEFMGTGMSHPRVLEHCGVDPKIYQGFAFGFGLTRLVMMRYEIEDIRLLFGQKKDFLTQF